MTTWEDVLRSELAEKDAEVELALASKARVEVRLAYHLQLREAKDGAVLEAPSQGMVDRVLGAAGRILELVSRSTHGLTHQMVRAMLSGTPSIVVTAALGELVASGELREEGHGASRTYFIRPLNESSAPPSIRA